MTYLYKLNTAWQTYDSMLCVGLDPDPQRYPFHLMSDPDRAFNFCKAIVDATADYACAFKPQIAYFSAQRAEAQLERLCVYIRTHYPKHVLVLDSKRGDIGDTAKQYAIEAFERYQADAVTINPYMGFDTIQPYLAYLDKGVIALCRTSNKGGSDFQTLPVSKQEMLFERIAHLASVSWNTKGQLSLVVGATFPEELERVRHIVGDMPLLVPGIGAQGGDIEATVKAGLTPSKYGMMINSSRAIMYANPDREAIHFEDAARLAAQETRDVIRLAVSKTVIKSL
jgi:orotidine-5'-phosphate decarboxylase